jgi:lipopolysaccharide biosynthesis regulator YciM
MVWLALAVASLLLAAGLILSERLRRRRDQAQAYLKGVRSMLSGDPDAAIEALSDAARLESPEAFETYLALGALFRRTGDLVRAIRLHRNMLLRPGIEPARRSEIELELAEDYRRSGMLAESIELCRALAERKVGGAAERLRDVLVERGDLAGAVEVERALISADGEGPKELLAHLLAAQARHELTTDPTRARVCAREAVDAAPGSADALMARAQVEAACEAPEEALGSLARALERDPRAALLAWPALAALPDPLPPLGFVEERLERRPDDAALHLLRARLQRRAGRNAESLVSLRYALDLDKSGEVTLAMRDLLQETEAPDPDELPARHDLLMSALRRRVRPLRCRSCGTETLTRAWRCRRCGIFEPF